MTTPASKESGRVFWKRALPWMVVPLLAIGPACSSNEYSAQYEEGEEFPGGATTNAFLLGSNAYTYPATNITDENETLFFSGNSFFNQAWVQAPASTMNRDGLGPLFNARSCAACHFKDGRGRPPLEADESFEGILLRLSIGTTGANEEPIPDPNYGGQLQPFSILDVPAEGYPTVSYEEIPGTYPDGTSYTLLQPTYQITELAYGALHENIQISPRVAPAVIGLGLLEAIPEERLLELADPEDTDGDGISGRVIYVPDVENGGVAVGRFGWKNKQPSVRQQSAGAFLGDVGITSSSFANQNCTESQTECAEAIGGGEPELEDHLLERVDAYASLIAVPVRTEYDTKEILRGKKLFNDVGCADCHTPKHQTAGEAKFPEVEDQTIFPYTDMLLHDMGDELGDGRPVFGAEANEWRTQPLWGIRFIEDVNKHDRLLHDGRARGIEEAILWHGGEGEASREAFKSLDADERQELVDFVHSL